MRDGEFAAMALQGLFEAAVVAQEGDDIVVSRTRVRGEGFEIASSERAQPGPGSTQGVDEAGHRGFDRGFPAEQ